MRSLRPQRVAPDRRPTDAAAPPQLVSVTIAARRGDRTNADQQAQQRQRDRLFPRTDPDPSEDGGVAGSLQRLLFGENPDSSEGGGFQLPPGLPISPEVDYQIASSFYRGQLQAAQTGRQQAAAAAKLADLAIRFTAA